MIVWTENATVDLKQLKKKSFHITDNTLQHTGCHGQRTYMISFYLHIDVL